MTETTTIATTREDDSRFYPYPPTDEQLDSVTTVISGTDNKPWIKKWYGSSATAWCVDNMTLLAQTLKNDGRKAAIDLGKDEAERLRDIKRDAGHLRPRRAGGPDLLGGLAGPHRGGHHPAGPAGAPGGRLVRRRAADRRRGLHGRRVHRLRRAQFNPRFEATEMQVYNQPLGIAGTLDMIIVLTGYAISYGTGPRGEDEIVASPGSVLRICVDAKTGRSPEGTWKEQLAAYRRMTECLLPLREMHPMPATDCGAVLHLRPEYPDGYLLMLVSARDDEAAWGRFLKAVGRSTGTGRTVKGKPGTVDPAAAR